MTIRGDQKENRRQDILYAGLSLFIQKGYSGTKIKDIAQTVGMSVGLLFHYFASKEELLKELVRLGIEGPMTTVQPTELEPMRFFEETANRILSYIQEDPFVCKMFVLMNQTAFSSDVPDSVKALLQGFDVYAPTVEIMRRGQKNGSIRAGDPLALTVAYWSAIQGVAETLAMYPALPCPESGWIADIIRNKIER